MDVYDFGVVEDDYLGHHEGVTEIATDVSG
jgi:hypothetical protein